VEGTLVELKECLDSKEIPSMGADCDYCKYREAAGKALWQAQRKGDTIKTPAVKKLAKKDAKEETNGHTTPQLF
jgi:hypothetical protein